MNLLFEGKWLQTRKVRLKWSRIYTWPTLLKKVKKKHKTEANKKIILLFKNYFGDSDEFIMSSNMTVNYLYFYNRIQEKNISVDELFSAIQKLEIMQVNLDSPEDDPQLILKV